MTVEMDSLLRGLLEPDPKKRLGSNSIEEIKGHKFFREINWELPYPIDPPFVPPTFQKSKLDLSTKQDMATFVDSHFKESVKPKNNSSRHKTIKLNEKHFEFLRYDILHAMNKQSTIAISRSQAKLQTLRSNLIDTMDRLMCDRSIANAVRCYV